MSWTLLLWSCHSCSLCSTLAPYSWAYPLQTSTSHVQCMHKSFTFLLVFYDHTLSSVKGRSSLRSASDRKYVVPGTRLVFGRRSFTVAYPSTWNSLYPVMSAIPSLRLSSALNWRLTSSAIPMDSNDFPASICTSELCKKGYMYIRLQLYCIVLYF